MGCGGYSEADAVAVGTLNVIICDGGVAAADGDACGDDVWRRRHIANVGIDHAVVCGRTIGDAPIGSGSGGGCSVVVEHVALDDEIVPQGEINEVVRIDDRRGDEV